MKRIFLVLLIGVVFTLSSCTNEDNDSPDHLEVYSTNEKLLKIQGDYIYILKTVTESDILELIQSSNTVSIHIDIFNNLGEEKSSDVIYDFDIVQITSQDLDAKIDYYIIYVDKIE